jgi:phosphonate C-P lyase system protein PhnK
VTGPATATVLDVEDLTVAYGPGCDRCRAGLPEGSPRCGRCGTVTACRGVSFDLAPGEVLGIVGESGSGKSTVVAAANLDRSPTSGRVVLGGEDVTGAAGSRRRWLRASQLGIVYQTPQQGLDFDISAGGNVALRLLAVGWRSYDRIRARALELLAGVELPPERVDAPVRSFSGGMRQRVQLARAMAPCPPVLLLDEPTSGLDVSVQARVLDLIRALQRRTGVAMVVVSHDLAVVRMLAQRVLVMRHGRVVEEGLTDQVLSDPAHPYSQLLVSAQL